MLNKQALRNVLRSSGWLPFYVDTLVYAHVLCNGLLQMSAMKSKNNRVHTLLLMNVTVICIVLVVAWGRLLPTPTHLHSPSRCLYPK